ncbi:glucose-1-phosphate thymidylyltransferase [Streptomyces cylindrosporus]|uniref:Glucose-1-phosphate thymidylyltransferase n=1 Tax=Streptomyces cylindrosporus TaxID=2927583 RepID=A0ABS9YCT3_9ACTN|nr:glucose-1-phosphate thymidylyltransferase [Streptomyces cylindrosporus]MCI3275046.1 glucose-1-phosphate thymidylyltransferase [Streptomyces cylindrosporus]
MKALVLSGGSGTRLRPITHTSAKQLVPVGNKPVLFHGLEAIAAAGVRETGIVVGGTRAEIEAAVGDGSRFGLDVTYLWQPEPKGLAHAVKIARDYLGDDDFLMYLGDNIVADGVTTLVERFRVERPAARIMLARVPDPRQFGVAELSADGRVVALQEKPREPRSDLAVIGVYLFNSVIHKAVAEITPSARGELEITDAIQWLVDHGLRVASTITTGFWKDTGNVPDLLAVNRVVLQQLAPATDGVVLGSELVGRVVVEPGALVTGSRVVGPAIIGPGAVVTESAIGPFTSIAADCRITDSWIEDSIVLPRASITGVRRIESSLIGQDVVVTPTPDPPRGHRLVLGDHCKVEISS